MKLKLLLLLSLMGAGTARAELKWEQTQVDLHPQPGDTDAVGHFKYANTGDKPVRFMSVKTSCGCTTTKMKSEVVAPNEAGEIAATFKIGGAIGSQSKTVTVETDDPTQRVTVLTLHAVITPPLELKPTFIYWGANEAPKAKSIVVTPAKDYNVTGIKVTSTSQIFSTVVKPDGAGAYRIEVSPQNTGTPINATLTIVPEVAQGNGKAVFATARVSNSAAPAP